MQSGSCHARCGETLKGRYDVFSPPLNDRFYRLPPYRLILLSPVRVAPGN